MIGEVAFFPAHHFLEVFRADFDDGRRVGAEVVEFEIQEIVLVHLRDPFEGIADFGRGVGERSARAKKDGGEEGEWKREIHNEWKW